MSSALITDLLDVLDKLAGGVHAGFRPVHARGLMYSGTFTPSPEAAKLTPPAKARLAGSASVLRRELSS
jgi:catalase